MTTEASRPPHTKSAECMGEANRAVMEALRGGQVGAPLLRALMAGAKLTPDQAEVLDLLIDLDEAESGSTPVNEAGRINEDEEYGPARELSDLRQANDTLAGALGACPVCWGGDLHCYVCRGRGRPGFAIPDLALFDELVAPAVRRVSALRPRANGRGSGSRHRV